MFNENLLNCYQDKREKFIEIEIRKRMDDRFINYNSAKQL